MKNDVVEIARTVRPETGMVFKMTMPQIYQLCGRTHLDEAQLELAKYVVLFSDYDGYYYSLNSKTTSTSFSWFALGWRQDGVNGHFSDLFFPFKTMPSRRIKLFRGLLDTFSSLPLGERSRFITAGVYSTSMENKRLVLTEEKIFHLVPAMQFLDGVKITDPAKLAALFPSSHSCVIEGPYFNHLTYNINYSTTSDMRLSEISGETICLQPIANLAEMPRVRIVLGDSGIDNPDGTQKVNCPNCRENFLLYASSNPNLMHLERVSSIDIFNQNQLTADLLTNELEKYGVHILDEGCNICQDYTYQFGQLDDTKLNITCICCGSVRDAASHYNDIFDS